MAGSNVIVSTPTGSGKSLVALGAHVAALGQGQRAYYTAPIKALVSEKFFALCRTLGSRERRHDDRRRRGEPRRAGHLLHRGDPGQPGAARGRRRRRRPGGDGRVPLLRRPRPRLGVAGAAARAAPRPVPPDVGDARRRHAASSTTSTGAPAGRPRTSPRPLRPVPLDFEYRRTPLHATIDELLATGQAPIYVVHFTQALGGRAGPVAHEHQRVHPGGEGGDHRGHRRVPLRGRASASSLSRFVRHGIGVHHAGLLPEVPAAGRAARPGGPAQGHLRHRHARRRHQRADPHRAVHPAVQVRRHPDPAARRPRVPPDRRPGRPGRATTPRAASSCRPPSTTIENDEALRQGRRRPEEEAQDRQVEAAPGASCPGPRTPSPASWRPPSRSRRASRVSHAMLLNVLDRPGDGCAGAAPSC